MICKGGKLAAPTLEQFLQSLRVAWKGGEVRPTAKARIDPAPGLSLRPDPLVKVTDDLRTWFGTEPSRTGCELLDRLQSEHPATYPDGLLRTVQRRPKIWRGEAARALVLTAIIAIRRDLAPNHEAAIPAFGNIDE